MMQAQCDSDSKAYENDRRSSEWQFAATTILRLIVHLAHIWEHQKELSNGTTQELNLARTELGTTKIISDHISTDDEELH